MKKTSLSPLNAVSPVDGRYRSQTEELSQYFSEASLIRYRLLVEVEYFIGLCELPLPELKTVDKKIFEQLRGLCRVFDETMAAEIKATEKITNHDVKAVEYFLKKKIEEAGIDKYKEFVHFGLTSQDINNTALPMLIRDALNQVMIPMLELIKRTLTLLSSEWKDIPMLAHTHGQPATPTRLGKEIAVFIERINSQIMLLQLIPWTGKFGGATGNFNAHHAAYPEIDWKHFANRFLKDKLDLLRQQATTQIEHYDNLAAVFDALARINTICIDFSRDMWTYISMEYFSQKISETETGSSAMPHKVNPIDFENAEGNFGMANAMFHHFSAKLPVSRLQRDLTDSTVTRNIGVAFAHTLIALKSLTKGISKLQVNVSAINADLEKNWAVVAEAIQTILRKEGYPNPYEALKDLTRKNEKITKEVIHAFIDSLKVNDAIKTKLKSITPFNYTGI
ncbi:MAG: adenylosuccinate lyase [Bacteroidia bacterium]|nr:adenylosuccinate lyase [Bacteroidia bacterium]